MPGQIPLKDIKYVLLDMDGTLLDLYFDDYFWGHLVPEKYAEKHDMTFGAAKDFLYKTYKSHEKTLNWCDIDFWSKELRLDIPALKEQIRHLIEVHPHVIDFLKMLRRDKKKIYLLTLAGPRYSFNVSGRALPSGPGVQRFVALNPSKVPLI